MTDRNSVLSIIFGFRWAVSTVMTRQNFIPSSSSKNSMVNALIPFWDMSNHTNAKVTN